jgi:hypothetical protein
LLLVDDLAVASFTSYGLQKKFERVDQYCKDWNLRCNLSKCKIMVFKKGGTLKATERWNVNGQNIEVVDIFNYLQVTLDSTGSLNKQKTLAKMKSCQALKATDKCIAVTPNIKVQMLENIYKMVCDSKITFGIEIWGHGAWKEVDKVYTIFCKKITGISNCVANGFVEMELGRESRKGVFRTDCKIMVLFHVFRDRSDKTML